MATLDKLVVIVGTTASGKSAAAMQMAQEHNGEIVCADSRTVYKTMDIGTAKPSRTDQNLVPHHLIDVVRPDEPFTAADFQKLAKVAIADVQSRGKLPIIVGGTGLYIDSILYDYSFRKSDPKRRQELEKLTVEQLQQKIEQGGLQMPLNDQNKRHLVRVLETNGQADKKKPLRANTLVLGIHLPSEVLQARIAARVDHMIAQGLANEVNILSKRYGWQIEPMKSIGYQEWQAYFDEKQSLEETRDLIIKNTWQYARRQRTWFRRNKDINWRHPE